MSIRQIDQDFLVGEEYDEDSKLNTRIEIQRRFSTNPDCWFRWLFDRLALPPRCRLLELGSGPGTLWLENCDRLAGDWAIVMSDLSPGMLGKARLLLAPPRFTLAAIDAESIPFAGGHFDAVIANGLFDHVPDRQRAFEEICRVLKPGGYLYTATGGRSHMQELESLVRPFVPDADYGGVPERFGLENGAALLSPWFTDINCHHYQDELVFRECGPILAYVLSEADIKNKLVGEQRAEFIRFVERQLMAEGSIRVTLDKGLFSARKPVA